MVANLAKLAWHGMTRSKHQGLPQHWLSHASHEVPVTWPAPCYDQNIDCKWTKMQGSSNGLAQICLQAYGLAQLVHAACPEQESFTTSLSSQLNKVLELGHQTPPHKTHTQLTHHSRPHPLAQVDH